MNSKGWQGTRPCSNGRKKGDDKNKPSEVIVEAKECILFPTYLTMAHNYGDSIVISNQYTFLHFYFPFLPSLCYSSFCQKFYDL